MDPVKHTPNRTTKPHSGQEPRSETTGHSTRRDSLGRTPSGYRDRYTLTPRYDFAQRCAQPRRPTPPGSATPLPAAPTGPSSPLRPFQQAPRTNSPIAASFQITIPNTVVGDASQIPSIPQLDFAGFPFRDLAIALCSRVEGNARISIHLHQDGTIRFQVLGSDGRLAPIRSETRISNPRTPVTGPNGQPLPNQSFIDLLSGITTNADGIEGTIRPILGENRRLGGATISVNIRGFQVLRGSSTRSVTQLGNTTIDASIPDLAVTIPSLTVNLNTVTRRISLEGQALPADPAIGSPSANIRDFLNRNWGEYLAGFSAAHPVVTLPPNIVTQAMENAGDLLGDPIGHGAGPAQIYFRANQSDGTFRIEDTLVENTSSDPAHPQSPSFIRRIVNEVVHFVRQYPSAPPRPSNDGEPLRVSRVQRGDGTLFLIDYQARGLPDAQGHVDITRRTDSDLSTALVAATGLPATTADSYVRDGQIPLPVVLENVTNSVNADGNALLTNDALSHLIDSYVAPTADGSIRHPRGSTIQRESFRLLDVLAALRPEYRTSRTNGRETRTLVGGLRWLAQPNATAGLNGQQVTHSRTWYHADERYHERIANTQGVNATTLNVLPLSIAEATEAFQRGTLADPWIRRVGETQTRPDGSQEIAVGILGENRRILRTRRDFGNIVTLSSSLLPPTPGEGEGMKAYSQNIRLVPVDATHTLVIEDLDMATTANPLQLQWPTGIHHPLYEVPISTDTVQGESLTNAALTTLGLNPRIGSQPSDKVEINVLYKLRTAAYLSEISRMRTGAPMHIDHGRPLLVEPADGYDIRQQILDYLEFVPDTNVGPVLVINNDEIPQAVIANHLALLGVERPVIDAWLAPREITIAPAPAAGATPTATPPAPHAERKRYIRLQDLYDTAFAVTPLDLAALSNTQRTNPVEHFGPANFSIFRGLVEARLNPPASIAESLTARTERLWRSLAAIRAGASGRNNGITANDISISYAQRNGASPIQSYFFNNAAFAHTRPENDPSHVGNAQLSWFIPYTALSITTEAEATRFLNAFLEVTRLAEDFPQWSPALYPQARTVPCPPQSAAGNICVETTIIIGSPKPYTMGHGADFVAFGNNPFATRNADFLTRSVSDFFLLAPFYRVDIPGSSWPQEIVENAATWEGALSTIWDEANHRSIPGFYFARYGIVDVNGLDDMGATALSLGNNQLPNFVRDIFRRVFAILGQPVRDLPFEMGPPIGLSGRPVN